MRKNAKKISVGKKKLNKPATNGREVGDQSTIDINEISKVDFVDTHGNESDDAEIYTEISIYVETYIKIN